MNTYAPLSEQTRNVFSVPSSNKREIRSTAPIPIKLSKSDPLNYEVLVIATGWGLLGFFEFWNVSGASKHFKWLFFYVGANIDRTLQFA